MIHVYVNMRYVSVYEDMHLYMFRNTYIYTYVDMRMYMCLLTEGAFGNPKNNNMASSNLQYGCKQPDSNSNRSLSLSSTYVYIHTAILFFN